MHSKVNLAFSGVFQKFLIHTETPENASVDGECFKMKMPFSNVSGLM